jgi:solute:Na+ symporter, SSS family
VGHEHLLLGFNQYIIQRALGAKDVGEAQKGIVLAAFFKLLMPVIIVMPGIAAASLAPHLARPDEAYPHLMAMSPSGIPGLVFAALIAAILVSMGSKINFIATIFTMDVYRPLRPQTTQQRLVFFGRLTAVTALIIAILAAQCLLGSFNQAFRYIQEFTGFFTPGICVIFLLRMFWARGTAGGALVAVSGSAVLSFALKNLWPALPFMDRVGLVFLVCLGAAALVSMFQPRPEVAERVELKNIPYSTSAGFNLGAVAVIAILCALHAVSW